MREKSVSRCPADRQRVSARALHSCESPASSVMTNTAFLLHRLTILGHNVAQGRGRGCQDHSAALLILHDRRRLFGKPLLLRCLYTPIDICLKITLQPVYLRLRHKSLGPLRAVLLPNTAVAGRCPVQPRDPRHPAGTIGLPSVVPGPCPCCLNVQVTNIDRLYRALTGDLVEETSQNEFLVAHSHFVMDAYFYSRRPGNCFFTFLERRRWLISQPWKSRHSGSKSPVEILSLNGTAARRAVWLERRPTM